MRLMREPVDGPVLAVVTRRLGRRGDRAGQRLATTGWAHRCGRRTAIRRLRIARELHAGMVWLNDHLPGPTVSRGPWGAAAGGGLGRTLGQTGLSACAQEKLITWDPPAHAGAVVEPLRRGDRPRGAGRREHALGARVRPRPRLAPGRRGARARGGTRAAGAECRRSAATALCHARPGLRRQGVRLSAAQGDLRPELRAGDAGHALLHRLPEAHGPALRGRRGRGDRPREGRGPARLRRRGDADRARRRGRARRIRARGLDPLGAARVCRSGGPRRACSW